MTFNYVKYTLETRKLSLRQHTIFSIKLLLEYVKSLMSCLLHCLYLLPNNQYKKHAKCTSIFVHK